MSRKRKQQQQAPAPKPHGWTLESIEEDAVREGCEILFGPQRVKVVRTVYEYAPYPEAGPGRWKAVHKDEIVDAAIHAARTGITADMLLVLLASDFDKGSLKKRLDEWRKLIHGT